MTVAPGGDADPSPAIALDDVEVVESGARILGPLSWRVSAAQRWVVLGPNGAGKSTLVRLVGGWRLPTRGRAAVLGEPFGRTDLRELRSRVGWVGGELDRRLRPSMPVLDVLLAGLHGALVRWRLPVDERQRERATALLARFGMQAMAGRRYGTLSEGERVRVLLARALLPQPELLLLDEPFAGLDLAGRELLVSALADLARQVGAPPIVLVTHHVEDIPPGFTHGLLLRGGVPCAAGPLPEALDSTRVSAAFGLTVAIERRGGRYTSTAGARAGPGSGRAHRPASRG